MMWDVVSATRRSSGVAPRACVRVYARVLVPPIFTFIHSYMRGRGDANKIKNVLLWKDGASGSPTLTGSAWLAL